MVSSTSLGQFCKYGKYLTVDIFVSSVLVCSLPYTSVTNWQSSCHLLLYVKSVSILTTTSLCQICKYLTDYLFVSNLLVSYRLPLCVKSVSILPTTSLCQICKYRTVYLFVSSVLVCSLPYTSVTNWQSSATYFFMSNR